ncbi:HlyD family secretion protein [Marinobacteraceae bacterium S3BR75-40.1]
MSEQTPAPRPSRRKRRLRRVLLISIPLTVAVIALLVTLFGGRYVGTENAYVRTPLINVAPQVSGPVSEVLVAENQQVSAGDPLFRIDPTPYRIAVNRAEAQLHQAANRIRTLQASYATKQEELALAQENTAYSKREYARQQKLAKDNLTSRSALEKYRHELTTAQQQAKTLNRDLQRIAASLGGKPDIAVEDHPDYQAAQASLHAAELDLAHTTVRAPFTGVAEKTPDPGTYLKGGTSAMSLVGSEQPWIEANFKETALTWLKPGQPVQIEVDTYPDRHFQGTVESISHATGAEFAILPPQNATGNWVKVVQRIPVRIRLDEAPQDSILRAGMSTAVEVDTGYHTATGLPLISWLRGLVGSAHASETGPQ